jgi:hypothetical protein
MVGLKPTLATHLYVFKEISRLAIGRAGTNAQVRSIFVRIQARLDELRFRQADRAPSAL